MAQLADRKLPTSEVLGWSFKVSLGTGFLELDEFDECL